MLIILSFRAIHGGMDFITAFIPLLLSILIRREISSHYIILRHAEKLGYSQSEFYAFDCNANKS